MFYRYEARNPETGEYEGIFSFLNPDHRRYFNRYLKEPRWYEKNPGLDSRCWFTEKGYQKYHHVIDQLIEWADLKDVRLLKQETLSFIACKGTIQCIEANGWELVDFSGVKQGDEFLLYGKRRVAISDAHWEDGMLIREQRLEYENLPGSNDYTIGICLATDFPNSKVTVFRK